MKSVNMRVLHKFINVKYAFSLWNISVLLSSSLCHHPSELNRQISHEYVNHITTCSARDDDAIVFHALFLSIPAAFNKVNVFARSEFLFS